MTDVPLTEAGDHHVFSGDELFFMISSSFSMISDASPFMKPQLLAIFSAMSALVRVMIPPIPYVIEIPEEVNVSGLNYNCQSQFPVMTTNL